MTELFKEFEIVPVDQLPIPPPAYPYVIVAYWPSGARWALKPTGTETYSEIGPKMQADMSLLQSKGWTHITVLKIPSNLSERSSAEVCVWKQNEEHWEGACGLAWEFTTGTPESNGFWCCPRCGRRITQ